MGRDEVQTVVRATVALMARIARRTRTQADDMMASLLQANENRLVDAVQDLLANSAQPPTDEQISAALQRVGIRT
jgi:hypothetical protein